MPSPSTSTFKLDPELKERIQSLATARRSPHEIVREDVEQFHADALAAWNHYQTSGLHATAGEADLWLAKLEAGEKAEAPQCHL
jgi:predicted transcriptional regulator